MRGKKEGREEERKEGRNRGVRTSGKWTTGANREE